MDNTQLNRTLTTDLHKLLTDFRYESSVERGQRNLMEHHINALMDVLLPFIDAKVNEAVLDYSGEENG